MEYLVGLFKFIMHIDEYLRYFVDNYGLLTYFILFVIIFCETGVVIFPFLPGDSLLFAAGALASIGYLNIFILIGALIISAILGDSANYHIGKNFGDIIIKKGIVKQKHLDKTYDFFEKHGGKTIVYARFAPIVRTLAPFISGVSRMNYNYFIKFNILSGILWAGSFLLLGYFFGNIPFVADNFSIVILVIIFISLLPPVITALYKKIQGEKQ